MTSSDLHRLLATPRVELGKWPTPISHVTHPGTPGILIKRDDLSGHGRGGVKTRKIEHLIGYMQAHGYREFITVVANITNLVHDILPVLRSFGLQSTIFVVDEPQLHEEARRQAFGGIGAEVRLLGPSPAYAAYRVIRATIESRSRSARPLIVLPGLMHPAGVVGNACGFVEMVSQIRAGGGPLPHTVFITVSSGTTFAGFLLAENALREEYGFPIRIVGVQVYPGRARWRVLGLIRWTERFLGLKNRVRAERIELVSSELNRGFGSFTQEHARLCSSVQKNSGITIDPIFGGKTWSVMQSHISGETTERPILYWHCGYTPDWEIVGQITGNG
jgi:1-aminocyclopropane-1-carboxylate deaminase/D-cysteine desulfhydrase-like pyridoxal-dependent ACC family enzyme